MKVRCRGFEGDLIYLTVYSTVQNVGMEPVNSYSIDIQIDKNNKMSMHNVKEGEIEVVQDMNITMDTKLTTFIPPDELEKMKERYRLRG